MVNRKLGIVVLAMVLAFGMMVVGCEIEPDEPDFITGSVTPLTLDIETAGSINTSNGEQWFKFTATTSTQYIIIRYGSLTNVYIQLYDKEGKAAGNRHHCSLNPPYDGTYMTESVTRGQVYYIKVTAYSSSGTFRILFSNSTMTLEDRNTATVLTFNTWTAGVSTIDDDNDQVFKFTATSITQRIHINFGTLTNMMVRVCDSTGVPLGGSDNDTHLTGNSNTSKYITETLTSGQTYYISVWPYSSTGSGTYWIAFNTGQTPPTSQVLPSRLAEATTLTANIWANGSIPTNNWGQWFKFTATASTQYIHASFITLSKLDVRFYDITSDSIGDYIRLSNNNSYTTFPVTSGKEYYIEVTPASSSEAGTYKITFNTSETAP
jgi:predicted RNA-binding protein with TRAM domain